MLMKDQLKALVPAPIHKVGCKVANKFGAFLSSKSDFTHYTKLNLMIQRDIGIIGILTSNFLA